jgi:phage repressor protein C with HTH and peptisase S24 domain
MRTQDRAPSPAGGRQPTSKAEWRRFLEQMTLAHEGDTVTVEVLGREFGDGYQVEELPLFAIEYDDKDDVAVIAVGGRDGRHPVVFRHMVFRPREILVDPADPQHAFAVEIVGDDDTRTLVSLHAPRDGS